MKHCLFVALAALLAITHLGCGDIELIDQPLQGFIDGQEWVFSSGVARASSFDEGEMSMTMYAGLEDPCQVGFGGPEDADEREIIAGFRAAEGEYELGFGGEGQTITFFYPPGQNYIATDGTLIIDEITETAVIGRLAARYDDDHEVNGNFELTRCDNLPAE